MNLPTPAPQYSTADQAAVRQAVTAADMANRKAGQDIDMKGAAVFLYDTTNNARFKLVVTSGVVSVVAA